MKRLLAYLLCAVLLCGFSARAEELPEYETDPLFPAKEDASGLWGFIDRTGAWRIAPHFGGVSVFRGNYALAWPATKSPADSDFYSTDGQEDCTGIINRTGRWVLPPEYTISYGECYSFIGILYFGGRDTGVWSVCKWNEKWKEGVKEAKGFFDIPSGYFSGLRWKDVWPFDLESDLIAVEDETGKMGYVSRSTGEQVIPCQYKSTSYSSFRDGVAMVEYLDDGAEKTILIDEQGNTIQLPEGIMFCHINPVSQGRIRIQDQATKLYGYADLQGNVVIAPQFTYTDEFREGYAVVGFPEGDYGCVDLAGNVLIRGITGSIHPFYNGTAATTMDGVNYFYLGCDGQVKPGVEGRHRFMDNGLAWVPSSGQVTWHSYDDVYLIDKTGKQVSADAYKVLSYDDAEDIKPWKAYRTMFVADLPEGVQVADFGLSTDFPEGMQVVQSLTDQKYLFLNNKGQEAFSARFDEADNFYRGLAWVRVGDTCGYIDMEGNWVFTWQESKD